MRRMEMTRKMSMVRFKRSRKGRKGKEKKEKKEKVGKSKYLMKRRFLSLRLIRSKFFSFSADADDSEKLVNKNDGYDRSVFKPRNIFFAPPFSVWLTGSPLCVAVCSFHLALDLSVLSLWAYICR